MYGVDFTKEGAQAYYDSIFELYAAWGVDYVKVDDICNTNAYPDDPYSAEKEIEMIRKAIDSCGRPMVLSLSPGPAVIEKAWHLRENANLWRSLTLRMRRLTWVRSSLCSGFPGALPRGISGRGRRSGRFPAGSGAHFRRTGRRCLH
jgi:hypothetical protein